MSSAQVDLFERKSPYAAVMKLALPAVLLGHWFYRTSVHSHLIMTGQERVANA